MGFQAGYQHLPRIGLQPAKFASEQCQVGTDPSPTTAARATVGLALRLPPAKIGHPLDCRIAKSLYAEKTNLPVVKRHRPKIGLQPEKFGYPLDCETSG